MNTPFYNKIKQLAAPYAQNSAQGAAFGSSQKSAQAFAPRFFVPGHKGKSPLCKAGQGGALENVWAMDLTEITGADNLMLPEHELLQSQQNMSAVYNSGASLYSASGSTSCIQAMLHLFCPEGSRVVMARNCHIAAVRACIFLGLKPFWVLPQQNGQISAANIEEQLKISAAKAVYITSPDYYGNIADVSAISEVCKKHGAVLLVDNAHGAYLKFIQKNGQDMHPLSLGADATADSAHKTLPCLTPAALLHLKNPEFAQKARNALNLFSSTSPSYPVLCSLDIAAGLLMQSPPDFAATAARLEKTRQITAEFSQSCKDPLRLIINAAKLGYTGSQLEDILIKNNNIAAEMCDNERLVFMISPYNSEDDFICLENALLAVKKQPALCPCKYSPEAPVIKMSLREAYFAQSEQISSEKAAGRLAAGLKLIKPLGGLPMGVPYLLPGEQISPQQAATLSKCGIMAVDVIK